MELHPVWHTGKVGNFDFTTKGSVQPHVNPKAWNNLFGSTNWIWYIWSSAAFVLEWLFWIQQLDSVHWSSGAHFMHSFSLEGAPFWLQINCEQNWTETKCAWRWSPSSSSSRPSSSRSSLSSSTSYSILHEQLGLFGHGLAEAKNAVLGGWSPKSAPKLASCAFWANSSFGSKIGFLAPGKTVVLGGWPQNQLASPTDVCPLCTQLRDSAAISSLCSVQSLV